MEFTAEVLQTGKTTTGLVVPDEVVDELGGGKRPKVTVTINGKTYRSSVASMGGRYLVGVSAEHRALTGVRGGDVVEVTLELDTAPREVEVPADFAAALEVVPEAKAVFARQSYSHQRAHVDAINGAKAPQTRQRRIDKAVEMLKAQAGG
ncbi:YdeI/OmpD-associated family protein [Pedococcus bigeumensis]|uniref:YdeI/OmpD-associated family protein n=1 Tax=Pedococcus bigeumensis TaxID=433644 RepID=UPI002FEB2168